MCKNSMYSTDHIWYDQGVYNAIMTLGEKYPNAIPVFGGALSAYNNIHSNCPDYLSFVDSVLSAAKNAAFHNWHEDAVGTMRRFCRLCLVDPSLIEVYIDMSFAEAAAIMGV